MNSELSVRIRDLEDRRRGEPVLDIANGQTLLVTPALGEADLLLVTLEDLPEGCSEVCGPVDIIPIEGDQS